MANVSVIGAGYVGLVTAACLAELGHTVRCVEIDPARLSCLQGGECPIHEPGLPELLARHSESGRLTFTSEYAYAIPESSFIFIAVNTPPGPTGEADTAYVFAAVGRVLEHVSAGATLVAKSTVPVGTGDMLENMVLRSGASSVHVASNPEFLREGTAVQDFLYPDRIVIGSDNPQVAEGLMHLYSGIEAPVICCSRRTAELAKYAANAFLATRVSFMNEMAAICEAVQADIDQVRGILGADPRIGPKFLRAGLGWGGSCLPKDVRALSAIAASHGCETPILQSVFATNVRQREWVFERLLSVREGRPDLTVGVLGLTFKPDTDDLRESPALDIISRLVEEGVRVRAHDPIAMDAARALVPTITYCEDAYDVATGADALLLATEWREYQGLDWRAMRRVMRGDVVFDGRNALEPELVLREGLRYWAIGRNVRGSEAVRAGSNGFSKQGSMAGEAVASTDPK